MAGVLRLLLLARAAGKEQSRRAAAALGPRAVTRFLAPPPLEGCSIAAAILPVTRASTSTVLTPTLGVVPALLPAGFHGHVRVAGTEANVVAALLPAGFHGHVRVGGTEANVVAALLPAGFRGCAPAATACCCFSSSSTAAALTLTASAPVPAAFLKWTRVKYPVATVSTTSVPMAPTMAPNPAKGKSHVRVGGTEANAIAAGAPAAASMVRPTYQLPNDDIAGGAAATMVRRPAQRAYLLPQVLITAPILISAGAASKVGGFPIAVGRRRAHEPDGVQGRGDRAFLVADSAPAALNLTGDYGGAMIYVEHAAATCSLAPPPLERCSIASTILTTTRASTSSPVLPRIVAALLPAGFHDHFRVRGTEANAIAAGVAAAALVRPAYLLANVGITGAAVAMVRRPVPREPTLQGLITAPLLCAGEADRVAGGGIPIVRRDAHKRGGVQGPGDCAFLVGVGLNPARAAALNLKGNYGGVLYVQRPGIARHLPARVVGVFGRRGYCTGEDGAQRMKNVRASQKKILEKLSRIQLQIHRVERININHANFSIWHRHEMRSKNRQLKKQVRMLPLWFLSWLLLGVAFACYVVVEVVVPRVAEIASEEFIKLAKELKNVANEVDEEKIKRMAAELTTIITKTIVDYVGGRVKTNIIEALKFWKWGRKQ